MTNNLDTLIEKAFENSDDYIPYEEKTKKRHLFSLYHRKNIKKISDEFFAVKDPFEDCSEKSKRRVRIAFICTLIFLAIILTGFIGYRCVAGIHVNEYNGYSVLTHMDSKSKVAKDIDPFMIKGINQNDYKITTNYSTSVSKIQVYENKETGNKIIISQRALSKTGDSMRIDNEHAVIPLSPTFINGKEYAYTVYEHGECIYITKDENSSITYHGDSCDEVMKFINATV